MQHTQSRLAIELLIAKMGSTEDSSGVQTTREELTERTTVSFIPVEKSLNGNFSRDFANYGKHGLLRTDPGGFLQTEEFSRHAEKISRFQLRKDDIWIVTFPKCGINRILFYRPESKCNIGLHFTRSRVEWMIDVVSNVGSKEPVIAAIAEQVANGHGSVRETMNENSF